MKDLVLILPTKRDLAVKKIADLEQKNLMRLQKARQKEESLWAESSFANAYAKLAWSILRIDDLDLKRLNILEMQIIEEKMKNRILFWAGIQSLSCLLVLPFLIMVVTSEKCWRRNRYLDASDSMLSLRLLWAKMKLKKYSPKDYFPHQAVLQDLANGYK